MSNKHIGIINSSVLENHLLENLEFIQGTEIFPNLLANANFVPSPVIANQIINSKYTQEIIDRRMNSIHQAIQLTYGLFFGIFHLFKEPQKCPLSDDSEFPYRTGVVGFFLLNCYTCLRENVVSAFFNTKPPSIEEYLPLDEEIPPHVPFTMN